MKCDICQNDMRPPVDPNQHVRERSPFPDLCMGCFVAQTQLELFIVRATIKTKKYPEGMSIMGPWERGWLLEILKDPRRFL